MLSNEEFAYYRCASCGLVFVDPMPDDLEHYYQGGYQPIPKSLDELRTLAAKEKYRLAPVMEKAGGDLLEIGPWIGVFSINAKDAGFKVDAIEMSSDATIFLREKVGISVTNTSNPTQALLASDKTYDVIALWHSLEHLPAPWAVLEAASKRLKAGGILLIAIPDIDSTQARTLGARWLHLDAPRHLYFWGPRDLARLVQRFGLSTLSLDTDDYLSHVLGRDAREAQIRSFVRVKYLRGVAAKLFTPLVNLIGGGETAGLTATFRAP